MGSKGRTISDIRKNITRHQLSFSVQYNEDRNLNWTLFTGKRYLRQWWTMGFSQTVFVGVCAVNKTQTNQNSIVNSLVLTNTSQSNFKKRCLQTFEHYSSLLPWSFCGHCAVSLMPHTVSHRLMEASLVSVLQLELTFKVI